MPRASGCSLCQVDLLKVSKGSKGLDGLNQSVVARSSVPRLQWVPLDHKFVSRGRGGVCPPPYSPHSCGETARPKNTTSRGPCLSSVLPIGDRPLTSAMALLDSHKRTVTSLFLYNSPVHFFYSFTFYFGIEDFTGSYASK